MKSKVSVIIPYYNDGAYIKDTLESVFDQTYSNIEIILVDDESTDNKSKDIFHSLRGDNLYKFKEKNLGPAAARNLGILHANGEYILPLDADDIIGKTYIARAVDILDNRPKCGIVYCKGRFFGNDIGDWNLPEFSMGRMLVSNIIFNAGLFRKKDWKTCGGYDESLKSGIEDWDFWLSILSLDKEVFQIPEDLFYYRIKSSSRNKKFEKDFNTVSATYLQIQSKHRNLYFKYFDEYLLESRKYMLYQEYNTQNMFEVRLKNKVGEKIPLLRKIVHLIRSK